MPQISVVIYSSNKKGRHCIGETLGMGIRDLYRFADYGVVLGINLFAVRIHFLLVELGEVEEMTILELIVPCLACTSLIQSCSSWLG
jgi:hypothetical protein